MKTKKVITFLSLIIGLFVSCFAFTACSSDDEEVNNGKTSSKHIVKMIEEEDGTIYETFFSYDSQGRVVKVVETESSTSTNSYCERTYQYGELTILSKEVMEGTYSNGQSFSWFESHSYTLENGKIVKDVEKSSSGRSNFTTTTSYSYNSKGYLTSISESGSDNDSNTKQIEWTDGNLTNMGGREFKYSNIPWNKGIFFYFKGSNMDSCLWPSGYWGNTPQNMPSQNVYYNWTYKYETSNGLVTKITITDNETGEKSIYNYVWE